MTTNNDRDDRPSGDDPPVTTEKRQRGSWPAPGYRLKPQRDRQCVVCGEVFASLRPSHVACSATCRAEAHILRAILDGRDERYESLPARMAAASGAEGTPMTRLLQNLAVMRTAVLQRRAAGQMTGAERAGVLGALRRAEAARSMTTAGEEGRSAA